MKNYWLSFTLFFAVILFSQACTNVTISTGANVSHYKPDDRKLYDTIVHLDSLFFNAYNTCNVNLQLYGSFFSDSIEFYHDKGGLMTSKQDIIDATQKNVCGKVTREILPGSIEVYPVNNYGAVEMGLHKFHNNTEKPGTPSNTGRFIIIWKNTGKEWKITRVISLH